jgi:CubicO group peptidase (beta-lactamase class C family)
MLLQFHDPVSMYWPEFAAAGKSSITIAHVLSHAWGMTSLDGGPLSLPHAIGGTFDGSCEVSFKIKLGAIATRL